MGAQTVTMTADENTSLMQISPYLSNCQIPAPNIVYRCKVGDLKHTNINAAKDWISIPLLDDNKHFIDLTGYLLKKGAVVYVEEREAIE
jgi:hypothetical protein